jgi:hypothetical protein
MHTGSQKESNTQTVSSLPDESVLENTEFSVEPIPHQPASNFLLATAGWLLAGGTEELWTVSSFCLHSLRDLPPHFF